MPVTTYTLPTASFIKRLYAAFIDFFFITVLIFLFKLGFPESSNTLFFNKTEPFVTNNTTNWVLSKTSVIVVWILYSIFMDCSKERGTFGKQIMGIQVADKNGNQISITTSILRNLFKIFSYAFAGLGFLFVLIDHKKQGWHDKVANTLIIIEK